MKKKRVEENEEINPYKLDKLSRVPSWLIILLLKFWAAAAAIFFIAIGGVDIGFDFTQGDMQDPYATMAESLALIIMIGLFLALFTNYIVRPLIRLMYNRRNNTFRYNMVNFKGFKSFLVSLAYMMLISIILFFVTSFLSSKGWVLDLFGTTDGAGIEPFTYAFCFILFDGLFIILKNLILLGYERIKYNKQIKGE